MAADVSTGINGDEKKKELVTRDLLGDKEHWEKNFEPLQSTNSNCSQELKSGPVFRELHDLNLPPPPAPSFASVCTLEKVKSALERAMRAPNPSPNPNPKPTGSHSTSKKRALEKEPANGRDESGSGWGSGMVSGGSMMLTVCPGCFQYLLVPKVDPRCPRCDSHVPFPKKAKLVDLNCSASSPNNN